MFKRVLINFIIAMSLGLNFFNSFSHAEKLETVELMTPKNYSNQFQLGLGIATPINETADDYETGELTAQLEYSAFLRDNWILGFGGGYQNMNNKISGRSLAIAKLFQRSRKLYRIYHPVYYALGFEFSYLFPASSQDLIPEIEEGFSSEFGLGLTNSFIIRFSSSSALSININVWRGTKTTTLQAVETSLMFGQSI